jgi:hypothetical protein
MRAGEAGASAGDEPATCSPVVEACDNLDNDCDGRVDEQLEMECGTSALGMCHKGKFTCSAGAWSECVGAIEPEQETCDAAKVDENCDGVSNEGCACAQGETESCGITMGVCRQGMHSCVNGAWETACANEVKPSTDVCDGLDNDCNGMTDDGPVCPAGTACKGAMKCVPTCSEATCKTTDECKPMKCDADSGMCVQTEADDFTSCTTTAGQNGMCSESMCGRLVAIKSLISENVATPFVAAPDTSRALAATGSASGPGPWETFLELNSGGRVAFRSFAAKQFVQVGGDRFLYANGGTSLSAADKFSVRSTTITAPNGNYLKCGPNDGQPGAARVEAAPPDSGSTGPGPWQQIQIVSAPRP